MMPAKRTIRLRLGRKVTIHRTVQMRSQQQIRRQLTTGTVFGAMPSRPTEINNYGDTNHYGDNNTITTGDFAQVAIRADSVTQISSQVHGVDIDQVRRLVTEMVSWLPSSPLDAESRGELEDLARQTLAEIEAGGHDAGQIRRFGQAIRTRLDSVATQAAGGLIAGQLGQLLAAALGG